MSDEAETSTNLAKAAYEAAKRYAREGKFAEALERHEWFHHHALEHHPAYYGVRLSFALSAWKELGEKYPPALESLRRVLDQGVANLGDGNLSVELFHDVVSIHRVLDEDDATLKLFRDLEGKDEEAATRRFRCMKDVALKKSPDLFLRYTPDLMPYLLEKRRIHRSQKESRLQLPQMNARMEQAMQQVSKMQDEQFDALCLRLIDLARTANRPAQASAMEQLVQHWKSPDAAEAGD